MKKQIVSIEIAGKTLSFETGVLAKQATSAIFARLGDTMVLATVVVGSERSDLGYFPLSVEYQERLYAGGRIKGSRWVKREGRPSDDSILTARLIDRSIRPLFPKEFKNEVQIVVTVLSVDGENEPDVLAINAVSAALALSPIPWKGPVAAVRMGFVKEQKNGETQYIVNPGSSESTSSDLDLVVTQTKEKTLMLEAGALQLPEEDVLIAIQKAQEVNKKIITLIESFVQQAGKDKTAVTPDTKLYELIAQVEKTYKHELTALIEDRAKKEASSEGYDKLIEDVFQQQKTANPDQDFDKKTVAKAVEMVFYKLIKNDVIKNGKRPDGRKVDEIRLITSEIAVLPRTHGSAIFQRGDTQALTIATLGSPRMEQLIESPEGEESKRYMHHYSMPPYSVGEVGRIGVPSRREIGHGALAERALEPVIPKHENFPYTIRVVSEILSSNGSTSMASVCGSTLALMDAGVPITNPVAGVAMGMMSNEEKYVILTDILGLEDFSGDMDFKVAGTEKGVTAIQLDVKILGLTLEQIKEVFDRARIGRLFILEKMKSVISESRSHISQYAPKIEQLKIPPEKIGELIGPGGIRAIMGETGSNIDVDDDGTVTVTGTTDESLQKAVDWIKGLTREVVVGEMFEGEVKRILPFGAFVEILPGKEGMVHVSQMAEGFVKNPHDVVSIGQKVKVRVLEIDEQGRINLSMVEEKSNPPQGGGTTPERNQTPRVEHPLTMQFRRERAASAPGWRPSGPQRRSGNKPSSRFRKAHY